jgi:two-component system response regulator NreC
VVRGARDLFPACGFDACTVRDIMTPVAYSVGPGSTVEDAVDFLLRGRIHRALVVEDERLLGIVTPFDVLRALYGEPREPRSAPAARGAYPFTVRGIREHPYREAGMEPIRVLLVDDHAIFRAGIRALLQAEPGVAVIGEASTGEEGIRRAAELRPDVVVMDLSMPGMGGLDATRRIAAETGARVLILTMHAEQEHLVPVLEAGASGYVTKDSADVELADAVRVVARGEVFLYPGAARLLIQGLRTRRDGSAADGPLRRVSARERTVLTLTAEGYSAAEIGGRLELSPKTVETYRQRGMEKLGLRHRSELVRFALQQGMLVAHA